MIFCRKCGKENEDLARFCQACGYELRAATASPVQPGLAVSSGVYAGFWQRFAAILIDFIVVSVGTGILTAVTFGGASVAMIFIPWVYEALMLSSVKQATLGKMALGLTVTDIGGHRLSFGRATGRHFAKYISAFILGIGFIMAAFTEKKQALHDLMAQTLVVSQQ